MSIFWGDTDDDKPRVKLTTEELDALALSTLVDETYDIVKMYCRLSAKSQKLIGSLISSAYQLERQNGEINPGNPFRITIVPNDRYDEKL